MGRNPLRGNLCTITDIVFCLNRHGREILFFFFSPHNRHNQQHNDDNPAHKQQHSRHETTRHDTRPATRIDKLFQHGVNISLNREGAKVHAKTVASMESSLYE